MHCSPQSLGQAGRAGELVAEATALLNGLRPGIGGCPAAQQSKHSALVAHVDAWLARGR